MRPDELYETVVTHVHFIVNLVDGEECVISALDGSPQVIRVPIAYVWENFQYRGMRS